MDSYIRPAKPEAVNMRNKRRRLNLFMNYFSIDAYFFSSQTIEAFCSKLQEIFDPQGSTIYSNRSLTPQ
jgi:hypothetical protein